MSTAVWTVHVTTSRIFSEPGAPWRAHARLGEFTSQAVATTEGAAVALALRDLAYRIDTGEKP